MFLRTGQIKKNIRQTAIFLFLLFALLFAFPADSIISKAAQKSESNLSESEKDESLEYPVSGTAQSKPVQKSEMNLSESEKDESLEYPVSEVAQSIPSQKQENITEPKLSAGSAKEIQFAELSFETGEWYEQAEVRLEIEFPLQNQNEEIRLRAGRDFTMLVKVTAQHSNFSGRVNVLMQNAQENNIMFSKAVSELLEGETCTLLFELPGNLMTEGLYITLVDENGNETVGWQVPISVVNYGRYKIVGIIAENEEEYSYFSSFGNETVNINVSEIEEKTTNLESIDIIVAEDQIFDSAQDTSNSKVTEVLQDWVEGGKTLVVGTTPQSEDTEEMLNFGLQEEEILQDLILQISNYESARNITLSANEELQKQHGDHVRTSYIGDSMIWPVLVNNLSDEAVKFALRNPGESCGVLMGDASSEELLETAKLPENSDTTDSMVKDFESTALQEPSWAWWNAEIEPEVVWEEKGIQVLVRYPYGDGSVLVYSIPLAIKKSNIYPLVYYRIVQLVLSNLSEKQNLQLDYESYGGEPNNYSYLLYYIDGNEKEVSVLPYLFLITIYITVLIPTIFLILRQRGKSKYLWGALPLCAALMTGTIYLVGSSTRVSKPYCSYIDLVDYTREKGVETVYFQLSAPTNHGAKIDLPENTSIQLEETMFASYDPNFDSYLFYGENTSKAQNYQAAVFLDEYGGELELKSVTAFSNTTFRMQRYVPLTGGFFGSSSVNGGIVEGTVSNQTETDWKKVYLFMNDYIIDLGAVKAGQEISLENCKQRLLEMDNLPSVLQKMSEDKFSFKELSVISNLAWDYQFYYEGDFLFAIPEEDTAKILGTVAEDSHSSGIQLTIYSLWDKEVGDDKNSQFKESVR